MDVWNRIAKPAIWHVRWHVIAVIMRLSGCLKGGICHYWKKCCQTLCIVSGSGKLNFWVKPDDSPPPTGFSTERGVSFWRTVTKVSRTDKHSYLVNFLSWRIWAKNPVELNMQITDRRATHVDSKRCFRKHQPVPPHNSRRVFAQQFLNRFVRKNFNYSEAQCSYERKDLYREGLSRKSAGNKYAANISGLCHRWPHRHYLWNRATFISCSHRIHSNK